MKKLLLLFFVAALVASCGRSVRIKGHVVCSGEAETIYLEHVSPFGTAVADSVAATDGRFSFKVKLPDRQQAFYNIRCKDHIIPLLVSPGERVTVKGFGNVSRNYTVKGSSESARMRELAMILNNGAATLDSLTNIFTRLQQSDTTRATITRQYSRAYYDIKRDQIRFIVSNPGSLAAMYGLYQRLPNDQVLFNGPETDVVYFRMVADSLEQTQPGSPYLRALLGDIDRMTPKTLDPGVIQTVNYPDIELPDMYGRKIKLSSLEGGVILLDFWSATVPQCRLMNAELKEVYADLHDAGFEVYQVS
ncbi:MAG: redoxin domain-containing protein, partial [Rikenellaceae bacterium]|nr:redoxin domain-containing protein [Rikenellaceae bacterium]